MTGRLLTALVDDAGLFPPEELPMSAALARHRADSAAAHPVLTGRFLCPAARLPELTAALEPADRLALGLITPLDGDAARQALERLAGEPRLRLAATEGPLPAADTSAEAARRAVTEVRRLSGLLPEGVTHYAELPVTGDWSEALAVLADAGLGAKVRCGGVRAELFPTVAQLAGFVHTCAGLALPFKATAGLHNAVRHRDPRTGFTHHGFLNLLLAVCRAVDGGTPDDLAAVLSETDPSVLAEQARQVGEGTAERARALLVGYGSCSTREPIDDLRELGLVDAPAPHTPTMETPA